jgi:hypothetical protein
MKNQKEKTCMLIDVAIPADRNVVQKEAEKKLKYVQQFMYRDTANVERAVCDCTGNMWSHRNSNERFKEQFGSHGWETFSILGTKDSCSWNITRNTECAAG